MKINRECVEGKRMCADSTTLFHIPIPLYSLPSQVITPLLTTIHYRSSKRS